MTDMNKELNLEELEEVAGGLVLQPITRGGITKYALTFADNSAIALIDKAPAVNALYEVTNNALVFETADLARQFAAQNANSPILIKSTGLADNSIIC
jgi:aminopeptidase-like protein